MEFIKWVEHVEPVHVNNGRINRQLISVDICQGMMILHKKTKLSSSRQHQEQTLLS